jgi:hypothetical protein
MQWLIILIALAFAVCFAMFLAKSPRRRRGLLICNLLDLVAMGIQSFRPSVSYWFCGT